VPLTDHGDCVLVAIDVQPGFVSCEEALARAQWLVSLAGVLEVPVVSTEEEPERYGASLVPPALLKPAFGVEPAPVLAAGRPCAVLIGFETDVCVYQSAVRLQEAGLRVLVVEDATGSPGEFHARGLSRLREAGVGLTHAKALAYEWVRTVEGASVLPRPAPFTL